MEKVNRRGRIASAVRSVRPSSRTVRLRTSSPVATTQSVIQSFSHLQWTYQPFNYYTHPLQPGPLMSWRVGFLSSHSTGPSARPIRWRPSVGLLPWPLDVFILPTITTVFCTLLYVHTWLVGRELRSHCFAILYCTVGPPPVDLSALCY